MTSESPEQSGAVEALVARYAAGTLSLPMHALVASHILLSSSNRAFAEALHGLAGRRLDEIEPVAIRDRDHKLAAIFEMVADETPALRPQRSERVIPEPIERLMHVSNSTVRWRFLTPGAKHCPLMAENGQSASLYRIRAGRRIPSHTHEGTEVTLVLKGGFSDVTGHYGRGDIAIADADVDHRPSADPDEECICFAVTDAPLKLTGPFGRLLQTMFGF